MDSGVHGYYPADIRPYARSEQALWHSPTCYDGMYNWTGNYFISPPAPMAASDPNGQWSVPFPKYPVMQPHEMQTHSYLHGTGMSNIAVPYNKPLQYVNPHHAYYAPQLAPSWLDQRSYGPGPRHMTAPSIATSRPHLSDNQPIMYNKWPQGPPQKPKQSGHAVWVGNLPHATDISHLKDHFSMGARDEIESVRLLSQTNCAFINFSSQRACLDAVRRHDRQPFHGYRLVCRFRGNVTKQDSATAVEDRLDSTSVLESPARDLQTGTSPPDDISVERTPAKYFILKSLTVGDLEASVRNGVWNPQIHHQDALNDAFRSSDAVWLVFSVNKSREFFGIARMSSLCRTIPENDCPFPTSAVAGHSTTSQATFASQQSRTPTARNALAPSGVVIQDRARGTIFWERQDDSPTHGGFVASSNDPANNANLQPSALSPAKISAFKVDWISLQRLPFKRTRGLRNAYNDNQIVQVARDGTRIDALSGAKIVSLFGIESLTKSESTEDISPSSPRMCASPTKTEITEDMSSITEDISPSSSRSSASSTKSEMSDDISPSSSHTSASTITSIESDFAAKTSDAAVVSQTTSADTMEQMVGKMNLAEAPVLQGKTAPN